MNSSSGRYQRSFGYGLYTISTRAFFLLVKILKPFNNRAAQLSEAQSNALANILKHKGSFRHGSIWFHVSSLGEYEQGKTLMEGLKKLYPEKPLVVTFFSPSGYQARQSDPLPDYVFYLPFENESRAKKVVAVLNPQLAIWVKYDLWYHYLNQLAKQGVTTLLIAALFRPNQRFFKPNAPFQKNLLFFFKAIFCQNQSSVDLLNQIQFGNGIVSGDPRYDRVKQRVDKVEPLEPIARFKSDSLLLVLGSSYSNEEQLLENANWHKHPNLKIIIAPHFTDKERVEAILKQFGPDAITYNDYTQKQDQATHARVLVIDRIGLLAGIYAYADFSFIGGGFWNNGLHNILEAACFGMPICFGPKLDRFPEAQELVQQKLASLVNHQDDFNTWLNSFIKEEAERKAIAIATAKWVQDKTGATEITLRWIIENCKLN